MAVTLPPPQGGNGSPVMSPTVQKGLARLLEACGLSSEEFLAAAGEGGTGTGEFFWNSAKTDKQPSLRLFLPWAAEELRKYEAKKSDPSLKLV